MAKTKRHSDIILTQGLLLGDDTTRSFFTFQSEKFPAFANTRQAANDHTLFTTPIGVIK